MKCLFLILLCGCIAATSCHTNQAPDNTATADASHLKQISDTVTYNVPITTLIDSPATYSGKKIRIIGYLHIEFEADCIYITEADYKQHNDKNALWVEFKNSSSEFRLLKYSNHYVVIHGTFSSSKGKRGINSGTIGHLTLLHVWKQPGNTAH